MGPGRPRADAGDHLNLPRLPRPPVALWAGLTGLPFAVVAVGALASRREVVPAADFALIDMAARRAERWHQLLGVFDRYGWHHPGPAYLYVVSFLLRAAGPAHGAQAQVAAAAVVAGAAAAGTVVVSARLWPAERRVRAAAATAVVAAAVAVVGRSLMANPWNPYVVVLPTLLTIVLAVAAARGSASALAAAVLVGSFAVQTDIGTVPAVGLALVGGAAGLAVARSRRPRPEGPPSGRARAVPVVLGALAGLTWVPVLVEQATGRPGNLTLLWRFFTSAHAHAGPAVGAGVTGWEQASLLGFTPPTLVVDLHPGWVAFAVSLAVAAGAVAFCWWRREPTATAVAAAGGVGTLAGLAAGAQIVGPAFGYLLAWTVAPAVAVVLAVAFTAGPRLWAPLSACALVAVAGLLARAVPLAGPAALADPEAAAAWRLVAPVAAASPGTRIGLSATDIQSLFALAGVADELDRVGVAYSVPPDVAFSFGPGHRALPGRWVVLVGRGGTVPAGYRAAGTADGVTVGVADTRPPGWA